ncbi:40S ribosomal protein S8, putative [Theileria equi strain WA]|uniref:40S ribosomal protein S8 n=1 Tax=Theileria equi strain WA TaxID=1537102 RepID=L1LCB8_THEEQ|nr:40S ribosomal protein S8, putative [Theileria equi strain WA]EKX73092.1 40S ribosomal protein S8, putative [Theileria equi strain WA]|eukprot:XP_004832544.1 40S ribosomal protein S8, putative [Theileria equi strain WA]
MGISRDSRHKRRKTGGRFPIHKKKRKYEMGRPAANTKLGSRLVRKVRCRGGNLKFRALRLDSGNFSWATQNVARKTRIIDVVYNASSNELVRTKTIVKNAIIAIDATPFKLWFKNHYGFDLAKPSDETPEESGKKSAGPVHRSLLEQFSSGRLLACVSSRPGQSGRCDGYILEGEELAFYRRRMDKKKRA